MASVTLDQVSKRFGATVAVDAVDLAVGADEFMVLVGPSGCGKSTTLRMIAGLEEATSGRIAIGGRDVTRLEPRERNIAMVFQNYALYPHKSVRENLAFGLRMRGLARDDIATRVNVAAEMLRITELLDRKPKQLSGGQMQRVALGRALVREPDVFLFDEPLSNLDAAMRVHMREEIARLHRTVGTAMIYVTHDQIEAMTLGDRICVMHQGRVQQVGVPLSVYREPANSFVARFIGSPEMNLISGVIAEGSLFRAGAFVERLPPSLMLAPGSSATLGIRPEHMTVGSGPHQMLVDSVEATGATSYLLGRLTAGDEVPLPLRVEAPQDTAFARGDVIAIGLRADRRHLFDADGRRISLVDAEA